MDRYADLCGAVKLTRDVEGYESLIRSIFQSYAGANLNDQHSLGVVFCISSEQSLLQRCMQAAQDHTQRITEIIGNLFPAWSRAELSRRINLAMVMSQPLIEAAMVAPVNERAEISDTGLDFLITSFR